MKVYVPEYYNRFHCIAADCPDSCCKEWEVDVDAVAAARYRALPGELGDRLRRVLCDTDSGTVMTIENHRCPMWRQDGLCQIQAELGHDALCTVCREFPRLRHDYGDFAELGLELSCPEAARLILSTPVHTVTSQTQPGEEKPEYDAEVMDILRRTRDALLAFLGKAEYTVPQSLAVLLLYAHEVQSELDGGEPAFLDPEALLRRMEGFPKTGSMDAVFSFFKELEILTPQWRTRLNGTPVHAPWTEHFRALTVYFVQRYWLQAVSDYDLISRAKLTVTACLLVNALGDDPVQTAQQFSKEIENDPDNVEALLDGAYTSPALTDLALLTMLAD